MVNNNAQKKKEIDDVLAKYMAQLVVLKKKRDKIIADFLETLKEKRIKELRDSLK
ncbi:MAG: hypothetical protein HZA35_04010 [Parcubacteria group bacterium]|nr:hypothetical protein [Parcubacteria group bacterium]